MSGFLTRFWRGDIRLVVAFWGFGVGFSWALDLAVQFLTRQHVLWLSLPLGFLVIPINLFIAVGVFRSGHAYAAAWAGAGKCFLGYIAMVLAAFSAPSRRRRGLHPFYSVGVSLTDLLWLTP
ncbi:MAG: hypothetical protein VXY81_03290 [Pseudomonadota bacterium]|nr:hypothetical protein [Pseudomonadota bacterium]